MSIYVFASRGLSGPLGELPDFLFCSWGSLEWIRRHFLSPPSFWVLGARLPPTRNVHERQGTRVTETSSIDIKLPGPRLRSDFPWLAWCKTTAVLAVETYLMYEELLGVSNRFTQPFAGGSHFYCGSHCNGMGRSPSSPLGIDSLIPVYSRVAVGWAERQWFFCTILALKIYWNYSKFGDAQRQSGVSEGFPPFPSSQQRFLLSLLGRVYLLHKSLHLL